MNSNDNHTNSTCRKREREESQNTVPLIAAAEKISGRSLQHLDEDDQIREARQIIARDMGFRD